MSQFDSLTRLHGTVTRTGISMFQHGKGASFGRAPRLCILLDAPLVYGYKDGTIETCYSIPIRPLSPSERQMKPGLRVAFEIGDEPEQDYFTNYARNIQPETPLKPDTRKAPRL